jgi:hypothetical protein
MNSKKTDDDHPLKQGEEQFIRARVEDSFSLKAFNNRDEKIFVELSRLRLLCVTCIGAFLGMILSVATNSVLFEISVNRLFAFYFGLIFCVLGSLMLLRSVTQPTLAKKISVFIFSGIVIGAGACSFVFRTEWLWWGSGAKVFIYTLLGIATSFTVTFSWVDIVSFCHDLARRRENPNNTMKNGLIESSIQVWLILSISILTGITYGLIFGLVQIEEMTAKSHSRERMIQSLGMTELVSLPFGAVIGGLGSLVNEYIRHRTMVQALTKEIDYKPLSQSEIDGV